MFTNNKDYKKKMLKKAKELLNNGTYMIRLSTNELYKLEKSEYTSAYVFAANLDLIARKGSEAVRLREYLIYQDN